MAAAFNKTSILFLLVVSAMIINTTNAVWVHVSACNEVCSRSDREKGECCRAHGHAPRGECHTGSMNCYGPRNG